VIGRLVALLGLLNGVIGIAIDAWVTFPAAMVGADGLPARSFPDAFIYFWTFFTHVTNLWVVLVYLSVLVPWRWLALFRRPGTQAAGAAYILLVGLYYHFMLAPTLSLGGAIVVSIALLHYVGPVLYTLWWIVFARHGELRWRSIPMLLVPGLTYIAWVMLRGGVTNDYPYDILDAGRFGYAQVAIGVLALLVAVIVLCLVLVGADKVLARRRQPPFDG
jgi:hypothetical protein